MEAEQVLDQIAAVVRKIIREELANRKTTPTLSAVWANEAEVMEVCNKSRKTLYKAIKDGKINPKDMRPAPIGKGYLFRRSALVKP